MIHQVIGPGSNLFGNVLFSAAMSAEMLPLYDSPPPVVQGGTPLVFDSADQTQEFDVPIPRLAGLDDIELDRIGFKLWSFYREDDVSVSGQPASGAVTIALDSAEGATVRLDRIELEDLKITASASETFVLQSSGAGSSLSLPNVVYGWDANESKTTITPNGDPGASLHGHLLVRPASGSSFGPPAAAAPHFAMPDNNANLYGPALGGASLSLFDMGSSKIKAVLRLHPPLAGNRFSLLVGHAGKTSAHAGLPNEVTTPTWSAANVTGFFDVRPSSVNVKALADAAGDEQPVVAEFPSDPGDVPVAVDFAGVARSLLKKAYPSSQGDDMGLKLLFTAGSAGELRVNLDTASARYVSRPLAEAPATLGLLGAPETLQLTVSDTFRPAAVSFTLDGVYGPARLTLDSDTATPDARHGFRVAGGIRIARRITLSAPEANLPIIRFGLLGRASEHAELLLALHKGDDLRIGPPIGQPLSVEIEPSSTPGWHRKEYAAPGLLPPHPSTLWLVAQAPKGTFWWHGSLDSTGSTQHSADDGATFSQVDGRPTLHVSVTEVDPETGAPIPLYPVSLSWRNGLLNADVVGVSGQVSLPPEFRRFWIAEGSAHSAFLDSISALGGILALTLNCQRDVDLTVSDAVLTYDPWNA